MRYIFVTASIWFIAIPAFGQVTTATFYGIVADSSGAVVPGASVTFLNEGTSSSQKKVTGSSGEFAFDFLRVGVYNIRIEATGFKSYAATGVELAAAQHVRRTFTLKIGATSETVNVDSTTPQVNTVSPEQRESVDGKVVAEVPLSRRNYTNLLSVGTGVTVSNAFVRRSRFGEAGDLANLVAAVRPFVLPVLAAVAAGNSFKAGWKPGGPWR